MKKNMWLPVLGIFLAMFLNINRSVCLAQEYSRTFFGYLGPSTTTFYDISGGLTWTVTFYGPLIIRLSIDGQSITGEAQVVGGTQESQACISADECGEVSVQYPCMECEITLSFSGRSMQGEVLCEYAPLMFTGELGEDMNSIIGVFSIRHTIFDGYELDIPVILEAEDQPPAASFKSLNVIELGRPWETTSDDSHMVGGVIRFDPSESFDPDGGTILSYEWNFDGGELIQIPNADPMKPNVVFKEEGVYTITLVVVDDEGTPSEPYTKTLDLSLQEGDLIFLRSAGWSTAFTLFGNFYTHVGMYIGNQQMIESIVGTNPRSPRRRGVVITPLSGWAYPFETYATIVRVRTANVDEIRWAIDFARRRYDERQQYDMRLWQKSLLQRNYYCSELIWAAYYWASNGRINLGLQETGDPWDWFTPVSPDDIRLDDVNLGDMIAYHHEVLPL